MFMATVQSVQRLIVDNTQALFWPSGASLNCDANKSFLRSATTMPASEIAVISTDRCSVQYRQARILVNSAIFTGMYHRQLYSVCRHCIIVNSAMFAGIFPSSLYNVYRRVSSSTLQCLQASYHRQLYNVYRHVSSSTLQCLQACIIVNSTMFTGMYHRQLYNVYRHVSSSTLQRL
jgi:hypothetical protein